jgi:hypothetical protein
MSREALLHRVEHRGSGLPSPVAVSLPRAPRGRRRLLAIVCATLLAVAVAPVLAQRGAGPAGPPPPPRAAAPIDLTGHWVAIVNEDWRWRMVTPPAKDYASLQPLMTEEARKLADTWTPAQDGSCQAYGVAGLMRMPTRLRIAWENDTTLTIDSDAGQQTRRLLFDKSTPVPGTKSLQGFSLAEWERPAGGRGPVPVAGGAPAGGPGGRPASGDLKVVTTNTSGGWLRRNGVPYSDRTTVTEFFDRFAVGPDEWLVVTTIVSDPRYLTQEFVTSSHFRREPDASSWEPTPCKPN